MKEVFLPQTDIGRWMSIADFPNEIWKDVIGFEDAFQVSNLGRIKRKAFNFNIFNGVNSFRKAHVLKPQLRVGGYYHVSLSYKGKVYTKLVHRLVAMAFIPNPYNLPQVKESAETQHVNKTCKENGYSLTQEPVSEDKMTISKEWFEHCKKSWYNEGCIDGEYNRDRQFEESVSEELEMAAEQDVCEVVNCCSATGIPNDHIPSWVQDAMVNEFIHGAKWQKEQLWKPADGDDLKDET